MQASPFCTLHPLDAAEIAVEKEGDDEGDDEPVKGKKAKVKESFLRGRETEIMTVGALKKILTKLPDSTKVQYGDYDDGVYEGIRINYSDGSSGTDPYFYIVF